MKRMPKRHAWWLLAGASVLWLIVGEAKTSAAIFACAIVVSTLPDDA